MARLQGKNGKELIMAASNNDSLKVFARAQPGASQIVRFLPVDAWAEVTHTSGKKAKVECYYGSGYLSQSSKPMVLPPHVKSVVIFDFSGQSRKVR